MIAQVLSQIHLTGPLQYLARKRVQAVDDTVGFHVDHGVAFHARIARLQQAVMVFTQVRKTGGGDGYAAHGRRQEIERGIDIVGESAKGIAGRDGTAARQAGFERHHGMNEAMRIGEDSIQRGEAGGTGVLDYARGCTWGYGLGGQAGHRGFETGPRQPAVLAGPVQVPRETGVRIQVSIADNLKVTAVGIQHAGQHFGHLGPFPGRPQTVGQQSNYASGGGVEPARGDQPPSPRWSCCAMPATAKSNTTSVVMAVARIPKFACPNHRATKVNAAMSATWTPMGGPRTWNRAVANARPTKVPARRRTPRLNVLVKSGFKTMATVMGAQ